MSDNNLMFSLDHNLQIKWGLGRKLLATSGGRNHLKG